MEGLEGRLLGSLDVKFALGVGVTGTFPDLRANAAAIDAAGDVFVTGSIRGVATFGAGADVRSAGNRDLFVAKFLPSGALAWAEAMPGANANAVAQGSGIAVDPAGNLLLTGSFSGTVDFDPGPGATNLVSGGIGDAFVAKLDGAGRLLWARDVAGTPGTLDAGQAVATDAAGNVYATGHFAGRATFGGTALVTGDNDDAFATKLDPNGTFLWAAATHGSATSRAAGTGIAVDGSGNVAVAGSFSGSVNFDPGAGVASLASAGSTDAFLWKLGPSGALAWADRFGGSDFDQANGVAFDAAGDAIATGTFTGTVAFGGTTLTAGGLNDVFVLKVDPAGLPIWARSFAGTTGAATGRGVAVDGAGNIVTAGDFAGTVDFDPGPGAATLTAAGSAAVFVSVLDPGGTFVAARGLGGPGFNAGLGVAVNASGAVAVAGPYTGPTAFGTASLASFATPSIFAAELIPGSSTLLPPGAPQLEAASDSGVSASDGITAVTNPVFDVAQATGALTVELLRDGTVVGSRVGPGPIADPGPVPDGVHSYAARQRDGSGTAGPLGPATSITIDTTPPAAPAAPGLLAADDSGIVGDGITNVRRPRLIGQAEPGSTVQLLDGAGSLLGTATAGSDGSYRVAPGADLADGARPVRVRAVDVAGNVGPTSPAFALTIDTVAPAAPAAPGLLAADDSGTVGDGITNVRQPRLTGQAGPNATVQVLNGSGTVLAAVATGADGSYVVQLPGPLADGTYSLGVRAVDVAGNVGPVGPAFLLTIDTTPPTAPAAPTLVAADDTGVVGDGITAIRRPHLAGRAEAGATVQILDASGTVLGATTAGPDGSFLVAPAGDLADGTYALRARAVDAAGNVGPAGSPLALTILGVAPPAPPAPALLPADDSGAKGDGVTNVKAPHLIGRVAPGCTVQVLDASGVVRATATTAADGSYVAALPGPMGDGVTSWCVRAVDVAGNVGATGPAFGLTIATVPPPAPAAPTLLPGEEMGPHGSGITRMRRPIVAGRVAPGLIVELIAPGGAVAATTTARRDGVYQVQVSGAFPIGPRGWRVRVRDAAGNVSAPGAALVLRVVP